MVCCTQSCNWTYTEFTIGLEILNTKLLIGLGGKILCLSAKSWVASVVA